MTGRNIPRIFSHRRRLACAARAARLAKADRSAHWLLEEMTRDIEERLAFMQFRPGSAMVSGAGASRLGNVLAACGCKVSVRMNIDEELPIVGAPFDLVVSLNRLGTVNDLPGALIHMRKAISPGGVMIASLVGAGSLPALRKIMLAADGQRPAARIHPQIENRAASALLERAGFARHVVDTAKLRASYASLERMIADLREQALTNVLADPPPPLGKAGYARALDEFERLRDDEGRVTETFEMLTLTGWS